MNVSHMGPVNPRLAALLASIGMIGCVVTSSEPAVVTSGADGAVRLATPEVVSSGDEPEGEYTPPEGFKDVFVDEPAVADEAGNDELGDDSTAESTDEKVLADANLDVVGDDNLNVQNDGLNAEVSRRDLSKLAIPIHHNPWVQKWIDYFTTRGRSSFELYLHRASKYRPTVEAILSQGDVPAELTYLALIESGYATHARSSAKAVGIWQFIEGTGRRYGMRINRYVDERKDVLRATEAAAKYLRDLYNVFGSWHLALAGYNCGEVCAMRAVFKGGTRDFWKLADEKLLPKETRNYVPKFMAAVIIGENPEQYGFKIDPAEPFPEVAAVEIPAPVHLRHVASALGLSESLIRELNPHLVRGVTPPGSSNTYEIWLPVASAEADNLQASVAKLKGNLEKVTGGYDDGSGWHRVARGQTLSSIAQQYHLSISQLKRMNSLKSSQIRIGQRLRISVLGVVRDDSSDASVHVVRRGENLGTIARKYRTSVVALKKVNSLKSNRIYPDLRLTIPGRVANAGKSVDAAGRLVPYKVRRGDTLTSISQRFGVSIGRIKTQNRLRNAYVYAGQVLKIPLRE